MGRPIEIRLIGFGDDQPACFNGKNLLQLAIAAPATPWAVLQQIGIEDTAGLVLMDENRVIPPEQWHDPLTEETTGLTLLSAFEGG